MLPLTRSKEKRRRPVEIRRKDAKTNPKAEVGTKSEPRSPYDSSRLKLRGGQQQASSHDVSTAATSTSGKLSWSRNACMEDVHRTSGLCNLLAIERRLRDLQCNFAKESVDFLEKLDTIWGEFEALGNANA